MMEQAVGEARSNGQAKSRVHQSQRKDVAIAAKHYAEQPSADETEQGQHGTWEMRSRKQKSRAPECTSAAQKRLQPHIEKRLQDKFLLQRPDSILPSSSPRHRLGWSKTMDYHTSHDNRGYHEYPGNQHHDQTRGRPCKPQFANGITTAYREPQNKNCRRQRYDCVHAALRCPHRDHDQSKDQSDLERAHQLNPPTLPRTIRWPRDQPAIDRILRK